MNYKMLGRFLSLILAIAALFMIPAMGISLYCREMRTVMAFAITIGIMLAVSLVLRLLTRNAKKDFFAREGLLSVGTGWIVMSAFSCLPFVISGAIPNYIDALFEMVSGFSTTGASIITDLTVIPKGLLYWRSFSHWLGGMGVLVFLLAIVPVGGKSEGYTMHILRAESPGPSVGKLVPRIRQTAKMLYLSYIVLSVLCFIFLLCGKMPLFEALCTMFGTAGTGGFGVLNDSLASYSPYIHWVVTVFMLLFGINFSVYYLLLLRQFRAVIKDEELRLYFFIVVISVVLIAANILSCTELKLTTEEGIRQAAFHVVSVITTTGFSISDYDIWPALSKAVLFLLMWCGACAGSTGGGFKCARILILFKAIKRNFLQILKPHKVEVVRINDKNIDEKLVTNTAFYFVIYLMIILASFLLISVDGGSVETNLTAVLACFNNIGPGFDAVGPSCNFSGFSMFSKLILTFDMLAGRLEIFPIVLLLHPKAWKRG
ncbi:MAG: TrkH family potassium uptake protein [Clostridia bacterium]|nr:TrkH family potassium uptake protein [Clostridia bacterium]